MIGRVEESSGGRLRVIGRVEESSGSVCDQEGGGIIGASVIRRVEESSGGCLHVIGRAEEPVGSLHHGTGEGGGTSRPSGCHREGGRTTGAAGGK